MPVGHWLKSELRDWARERLLDNARLSEWFRQTEVERLLDEHDRGKFNHGKKLCGLVEEISCAVMLRIFDFGGNWEEFSKRHILAPSSLIQKKTANEQRCLHVCKLGFCSIGPATNV